MGLRLFLGISNKLLVNRQQEQGMNIGLQQAKYRAEKLGLSTALVAKLIGVSTTTLQNAFRGVGNLSADKEADLGLITRRLEKIYDALSPLRLPTDVLDLSELSASDHTPEEFAQIAALKKMLGQRTE